MDICSITTDMWTSSSMDAYMAVTVHYIDNSSWNRKALVISCLPIKEDHTSENLAKKIKKVLSDFGILRKIHIIVRDNGINVVNAMEKVNLNHTGCFLHALHLVVKNSLSCQRSVVDLIAKVRKIVGIIRHSSKAKQALITAQKAENAPELRLIMDQETRWSSTYYMLERFLSQKAAIRCLCLDMDKLSYYSLTRYEWELLMQLVELLKIFADSVKINEKEDSCISEALPEIKLLFRGLHREFPGLGTLRDELENKIDQYFFGKDTRNHFKSIEKNELYSVASLLDPRFKKKAFLNQELGDLAELALVRLVSNEVSSRISIIPSSHQKLTKQKSGSRYDDIDSTTSESESELSSLAPTNSYEKAKAIVSNYLAESRISSDGSPLSFWKNNREKYPELSKLAMCYLSAPISSVASECEFKCARDISNGERVRLLPKNIEKLLFLKHNLPSIGFQTVNLPSTDDLQSEIEDLNDESDMTEDEEDENFCQNI